MQKNNTDVTDADERITRIGVSLPSSLLEGFDGMIRDEGYTTRSEAIRDAIRDAMARWRGMDGAGQYGSAVITFVYDHHVPRVATDILDAQHEYHDIIVTTVHHHLSHEECMEVILAKGPFYQVRSLADRIRSRRGVTLVRVMLF